MLVAGIILLSVLLLVAPGLVFLIIGLSTKKRKNTQTAEDEQKYYYVCAKCGYQVFEDYNCCPNCGEKVTFNHNKGKFCSECGKELADGFIVCPYCGKKR